VGSALFEGVNKKIGARQLFFLWLLFGSTRTHEFAVERLTVMTEEEACQELLKWSNDGYLKLSGKDKDKDKPAYRALKMWGEFVHQIEKEKNFKGLFISVNRSVDGQRLYAIRLRPNETQIAVTSISALFRNSTRQNRGRARGRSVALAGAFSAWTLGV
jgi:hypothetical protein